MTHSAQIVSDKIRPRKRFGQHFLHDQICLQRIVKAIAIQPDDCLVEIGPGLGALTAYLLQQTAKIVAIELDRDLVAALKMRWPDNSHLHLYQADALSFDFSQLSRTVAKPLRVVGNLPYNVGTPLLFYLLQFIDCIQDIHVMLQKEVVDRLVAPVGSPSYSRISVMMQYNFQVQRLLTVRPGAFWPAPKVNSAVVRLLPRRPRLIMAQDPIILAKVVKQAFGQRRKILRNSLQGLATKAQLIACQIDPGQRPEQLSVKDYVQIANCLATCT